MPSAERPVRARMPARCSKLHVVSGPERKASGLRVIMLSALSAFIAPLVFVGIIVLRKVERRASGYLRRWNKRLQHEIARWT